MVKLWRKTMKQRGGQKAISCFTKPLKIILWCVADDLLSTPPLMQSLCQKCLLVDVWMTHPMWCVGESQTSKTLSPSLACLGDLGGLGGLPTVKLSSDASLSWGSTHCCVKRRLNFENTQVKIWFQMNIAGEVRIYGEAKIRKTKHLIQRTSLSPSACRAPILEEKHYRCT